MSGNCARSLRRKRQQNIPGGRNVRINIRLTEQEQAKLIVAAGQAQMSVPHYLVAAALNGGGGERGYTEIMERREALSDLAHLKRVLVLLGNNVNQIARGVNIEQVAPDETAYALNAATRVVERIEAVLDGLEI